VPFVSTGFEGRIFHARLSENGAEAERKSRPSGFHYTKKELSLQRQL